MLALQRLVVAHTETQRNKQSGCCQSIDGDDDGLVVLELKRAFSDGTTHARQT